MNSEQIIGIVRLLAMLATPALTAAGIAADYDTVYILFGCIATIAAIVWGWWFNNNMTEPAQIAHGILVDLKAIAKATVDRRDTVMPIAVEELETEEE